MATSFFVLSSFLGVWGFFFPLLLLVLGHVELAGVDAVARRSHVESLREGKKWENKRTSKTMGFP